MRYNGIGMLYQVQGKGLLSKLGPKCLNLKERFKGVKASSENVMIEEAFKMSISDKRKYFRKVSLRYLEATMASMSKILDEFCAVFELKRNM